MKRLQSWRLRRPWQHIRARMPCRKCFADEVDEKNFFFLLFHFSKYIGENRKYVRPILKYIGPILKFKAHIFDVF